MGKTPNMNHIPQVAQSADVHERIQAEAQRTNAAAYFGLRNHGDTPALSALLESALEAAGKAMPAKFIHEGKAYWLRLSMGVALLEVFDKPDTAAPLVKGLANSLEGFGHSPSH
jgi:hypothetical protein